MATPRPAKIWISCNKFTVLVRADAGIITEAALIVRVFIGQPLDNLLGWAEKRFGGLRWELL